MCGRRVRADAASCGAVSGSRGPLLPWPLCILRARGVRVGGAVLGNVLAGLTRVTVTAGRYALRILLEVLSLSPPPRLQDCSPSLKHVLCALRVDLEGRTFLKKIRCGRSLPSRVVGWPALKALIIEEASGSPRGRKPFWQEWFCF